MVRQGRFTSGIGAVARGLVAAAAVALWSLTATTGASATTADIIAPSDPYNPQVYSGWQAGTCKREPPEISEVCSIDTPEEFFERASAHPNYGFTQFIVKHEAPGETPVGELQTVRVDLPVGLSVNPGATERCPLAVFETGADGCPAGSKVGESQVTASVLGTPFEPLAPLTQVPVYNVIPPPGEPARFGLELGDNEVFLQADVDWAGDYHEGFSIAVPKAVPVELAPLVEGAVLKNRLVFDGRSGDGTFITTPTTCLGEALDGPSGHAYSTYLLAASYQEQEEPDYQFPQSAAPPFESPIPPGTSPKECDTIPYQPSVTVDPHTGVTDSPSGAEVGVSVPHLLPAEDPHEQDSSHTREARVSLPVGMGINPSAANGLEACTDAQFGKGTEDPVRCPSASRIGSVEIASPPLPEGSLDGDVYVGRQVSREPASGQAYRIFVNATSDRYGIDVRLVGNVSANPHTGQLTTTFFNIPQVPFASFRIAFDGGPRAPLSSPGTCGPHGTATVMTPWSGNLPARPVGSFKLVSAPSGAGCAATQAKRPFSPGFSAGTDSPQAGAFSPLSTSLTRQPGEQELKGVDVHLPPGLTAKLAGVSDCPEGALAAAAAKSGIAEVASASCPASSLIGSASVLAGSGPSPLHIDGKVFLAGPYRGAPLSLAVVTPATAGPFDLGSVVVRVALFVDRGTAQVRAVSDPIPHVYGGALLDIRSIAVRLDRPGFALNPTNCSPMTIGGTLRGGGANPADPAAFSAVDVSTPFQVSGCDQLSFKPRLFLRLFGSMRRAHNPKLRAVYTARAGDANTARAAVTLPRTLFLDQSNISTVCTRTQYAADACPRNSIYGHARAFTPLLDEPLEGPVYLRSSDNPLPDLVASLRGRVNVDLAGRIDSIRGRIRTTYDTVPDVPVSAFVMTIRGGDRGLLTNSRDQCGRRGAKHRKTNRRGAYRSSRKGRGKKHRPPRAVARIAAQNSRTAHQRPKVRRDCRTKAHHRKHRRHRRGGRR